MVHCLRYEWVWLARPAASTRQHIIRYDIGMLNGHGQLTGLVDRDHVAGDPPPYTAVPIARYVILFRMPELTKIRSGWSGTDGSITFTCIDPNATYACYEPGFIGPTGARFDAVVSDGLIPELMG